MIRLMWMTLFLYLCCSLVFASCGRSSPSEVSAQQAAPTPQSKIEVVAIESTLSVRSSAWKSQSTVFIGGETLHSLFFLDPKHGWAGGANKRLFKTDDGGARWQKVQIGGPEEANVQNIYFISDLVGWLVLQRPVLSVLDKDQGYFRLMGTTDGGQSWRLAYEAKAAEVTALSFSDERKGWLTGIQHKGPSRYTYLVLYTADQGLHWEDYSVELKHVASDATNRPADELNDGIMGVAFTDGSTTKVITSDLNLLKTSNDGRTWLRIGSIENKFGLTSVVRRFGRNEENDLWNIGGTSGHNGTRGLLFIEDEEHLWTKHILNGVFFNDGVSLSKGQFLACGFVVKTRLVRGTYQTERKGIILYSANNGKSWDIVYQDPHVQSINAITSVDNGVAWAAGENGLIVTLKSHN